MQIILSIVLVLCITLALLSLWRIPGPRPPLFHLLGLLSVLAWVVEVVGLVTLMHRINNSWLFNLYLMAEAMLVPAMVYTQRPQWRPWLLAAAVVALSVLGWSVYTQGLGTVVLTLAATANALLFVVLLLVLLWHMANSGETTVHRSPAFWVFMGMLVYFGGLLPVVGSVPVIHKYDERLAAVLWYTLPVLASVRYLLAAYGCSLQARLARWEHERS